MIAVYINLVITNSWEFAVSLIDCIKCVTSKIMSSANKNSFLPAPPGMARGGSTPTHLLPVLGLKHLSAARCMSAAAALSQMSFNRLEFPFYSSSARNFGLSYGTAGLSKAFS